MTTLTTAITHLVIALAGIAAVCILAVMGTIPGSDAFTVIVAVLVGAGVIAGGNLMSDNTPTTRLPPPAQPPPA